MVGNKHIKLFNIKSAGSLSFPALFINMFSSENQHKDAGNCNHRADNADNTVNPFGFRIVLFYNKVVYTCAENENTNYKSYDFYSHYFFLV